jgi:hypothetical protein
MVLDMTAKVAGLEVKVQFLEGENLKLYAELGKKPVRGKKLLNG